MASLKSLIGSTSYREAQAWAFVIINAIVLLIYANEVSANAGVLDGQGLPAFAGLIIVAVCTTFYTVLLIVPIAIVFNRTANEKADERDRRIHTEGRSMAFWTLFLLTTVSLIAYIFHASGDLLFHSVLMTILAAQFVYAFVAAVKYRRSGAPLIFTVQD